MIDLHKNPDKMSERELRCEVKEHRARPVHVPGGNPPLPNAHRLIEMQIEAYIDANSVEAALDAVATVCREKADHVRAEWQDEATAKTWECQANSIDYAAQQANRRGL
jgi:hypothetical protein